MNKETISPLNWPKLKHLIQKKWSKINSVELNKTNGDIHLINNLLKHHYHDSKTGYINKLMVMFDKVESKKIVQ